MPLRFDPTSLSKFGGLALVARNLVEGFLTGVHKSPYKGYSVEFAEHRQYYPGGETKMAPLWNELAAHQLKRRGLIIILSDCFDELDPLLLALRHFRHRKHEVLLFHVLAPEEIDFPFSKLTQFHSLESEPHKLLVDPARLRQEYLHKFNAFCTELRDRAR